MTPATTTREVTGATIMRYFADARWGFVSNGLCPAPMTQQAEDAVVTGLQSLRLEKASAATT